MKKLLVMTTVFIVFLSLGMTAAEAQTASRASLPGVERNVANDDTPTIFDVRKSLPMEPTEPSYHDFYINAGVEAGFKKGQYLPIERAIPVHDPVQNKQQAILTVPVGKVLVIHSERKITVARLVTELGDDERPTLEYESIMIGDRVDMKGITTDAPKNVKKKKTASVAPAVSTEVVATAIVAVTPTPSTDVAVAAAASAAPVGPAPAAPVSAQSAPPTVPQSVKTETNGANLTPPAPPRVTQAVPPPTA